NDVDHLTSSHFLLTGRAVPRRGADRKEDWPTYGSVLASLGRGRGPLPPFVSMMPRVPGGAPRFVEESHGQGAGWLGPLYEPMRIDETASTPGYRVAEFSLPADAPLERPRRRQALLRDLDRQLQGLAGRPEVAAVGSHYDRAFSLLASRDAVRAFDLSRE